MIWRECDDSMIVDGEVGKRAIKVDHAYKKTNVARQLRICSFLPISSKDNRSTSHWSCSLGTALSPLTQIEKSKADIHTGHSKTHVYQGYNQNQNLLSLPPTQLRSPNRTLSRDLKPFTHNNVIPRQLEHPDGPGPQSDRARIQHDAEAPRKAET